MVVPAGAEPTICGVLSLAGDAGIVAFRVGAGGAAVSTVKLRVAVPWLPAASVARTRKVRGPSTSGLAGVCEPAAEHDPKAGAPVSIEHSNVAPGSALKAKVGVESLVRPDGPESIVGLGAIVSIVQMKVAGLASTLP